MKNEVRGRAVRFKVAGVMLEGDLLFPPEAGGIIAFAHGSGSSRHSARNRRVARELYDHRFATLLLDLLTPDEEAIDSGTGQFRFDIDLLARRLAGATEWLTRQPELRSLRIGYFGASTGAAAALVAAAERADEVAAVVSRGGRPDLAGPAITMVRAPTLLIVGGNDIPVITINRRALGELQCVKELSIVPSATHLFEEPGTLEEVARSASEWFDRHLAEKAIRF